ncbi:MAG: serine protease, partial [Odoribacter splanchnicus]|nr:serine protease [Odoribacter splanchnicus]
MKRRAILSVLIAFITGLTCKADEGMWIPMLLDKYNIEDMQKQGFKLTAEDVYAINQASLKDAVIGLGREGRPFAHFCTGNLVSNEGLVITNHHCAFDMIQSHSSLEHNYLRDGFWARTKADELANPGITASVLIRMEDVTDKIVPHLKDNMTEAEREAKIKQISKKLEAKAVKGTDLKANIKPYFNGNQFFMSVFRIYRDVRLVGAPPSAIGKFGGDTDNWTWPRHTGDFSVLRIYAGENNEPAEYSEKNKPYRPAKHFKVSTAGVKEGDFTMVFGYPGTTNEYLTSFAVAQIQDIENPHKIAIRTAKLNIMNEAMESDELLRIKYAAKAAGVANAWKKWQGEVKGLKRFNTVAQKQKLEQEFFRWAGSKEKYNGLLDKYKKLYDRRKDLILASAYLNEAGLGGAEVVGFSLSMTDSVKKQANKEKLKAQAGKFYKNYDPATDERILAEML